MSRKILFLMLLVVSLLFIIGCEADEPVEEAVDEPDEEVDEVDLPDEITIGSLHPMTGSGAPIGQEQIWGVELAVQEINEAGGVEGIKLDVVFEDNRGEAEAAVSAMQSVISRHNPPAVISSWSSATLAILPIAEAEEITVLQSGASSHALAGASDFLFNGIPLMIEEAHVIAEYLYDQGLETAGIIYINDDSGQSARDAFSESFEAIGGTVVAEESHEFGETDFRSQLLRIEDANPDILFLGSHSDDAVQTIEQAVQMGIDAQLAGTSWVDAAETRALPEAEGLLFTSLHFDPLPEFEEAYKEHSGMDTAGHWGGNYYDTVYWFADALEYVIDQGWEINGESIRQAIHEIETFTRRSTGTTFTVRDDNTIAGDVFVGEYKDGEIQVIEEVEDE